MGKLLKQHKEKYPNYTKKAVRYICNAAYNAHTDPLFKSLKILKFQDLYNFLSNTLMFQITLGMHPETILSHFNRSKNFDRNLEYILRYTNSPNLCNQLHSTLIKNWNSLHISLRGWLKENYEDTQGKNKLIDAQPTIIQEGYNTSLNKYRLKQFKKAVTDTIIGRYESNIKCKNSRCNANGY